MNDTDRLLAISRSPIVSTDTLRPDHLCSALISEADRLGIELDRDLWQPAAAIAAHGMRGIVLNLPPRLEEISGEIVSELFDALNWAAPDGCFLGAAEGDGACFLWTLTLEAQADAINNSPGKYEAKILEVPEHWLSAIVNGDESCFDYYDNPRDYRSYLSFCDGEELSQWHISSYEDEAGFRHYHDAGPYGVLGCNVVTCLAMRRRPAT